MRSPSVSTFRPLCTRLGIAIPSNESEVDDLLESLPGMIDRSSFNYTNSPNDRAAIAWAVHTCNNPNQWSLLSKPCADHLRQLYTPNRATSRSSLATLAKLWHKDLYPPPASDADSSRSNAALLPLPPLNQAGRWRRPSPDNDDDDGIAIDDDDEVQDIDEDEAHEGEDAVDDQVEDSADDDADQDSDDEDHDSENERVEQRSSARLSAQRPAVPLPSSSASRGGRAAAPASQSALASAPPAITGQFIPPASPVPRAALALTSAKLTARLPKSWCLSLYLARDWPQKKHSAYLAARTTKMYKTLVLGDPEWGFQGRFDFAPLADHNPQADGKLLALCARFPVKFNALHNPFGEHATIHDLREHWLSFEAALRANSELPFSSLLILQLSIAAWFNNRTRMAKRDLKQRGLDEVIASIAEQEKQVTQLWTVYANRIARDSRSLSPSDQSTLLRTTHFFLLQPFCRAFLHASQSDQVAASSQLMHSMLGSPATPQVSPSPTTSSTSTSRSSKPFRTAFLGLPASASVVGPALAVFNSPVTKQCWECNQFGHHVWECPRRYAALLGEPCPGFDTAGRLDPNAWSNGNLTPQARLAWKIYKARYNLVRAREAPGEPSF